MADFDFSELTALSASLGKVADTAGPNIVKAITGTSLGVKKAWQAPLEGSATLGGLPRAIDFDITSDGKTIESEIGFSKSRGGQAALGNISEYGSPTIAGRGFGLKALEDNEPDFIRGLEIALEQAEKEAGL